MKTILVPVDLSASAPDVCKTACDMAKGINANLVLLSVVQSPPNVTDLYSVEAVYLDNILAAGKERAAERLLGLKRRCEKRGVKVRTALCTGFPIPEILRFAKRAALIVIGSHGHGAIYDLVVGSTTLGVLRRANCPVMVVPSSKKQKQT